MIFRTVEVKASNTAKHAVTAAKKRCNGCCNFQSQHLSVARDTAGSFVTLYIAIYRQVPDGSTLQTANRPT